MNKDGLSNERIAALRIRQLVEILGEALLEIASCTPDFKSTFTPTLNITVVEAKSRRLLSTHGWL
jgi:hypothetical protein